MSSKSEVIERDLYGGDVKICFLPSRHSYTINGQKAPSVTGCLGVIAKPALIYWSANLTADFLRAKLDAGEAITHDMIEEARKQHTKTAKAAADIGGLVHQWAEGYIKDPANMKLPQVTSDDPLEKEREEKVMNGVIAFVNWVGEHKVKFISSERMVYSRNHHYVGIMDAEAEIDGARCVIDFKTSKGIWNEYYLQVAAYRAAAEEEGDHYDVPAKIVRFDKDTGEFEVKDCPNHMEDFRGFLAALTIKNWQKIYA